jgi:thiamine biosynthesis lipoprotein
MQPRRDTDCGSVRKEAKLGLAVIALAGGYWLWSGARRGADGVETVRVSRPMMGTLWTIDVVTHGRRAEARDAVDAAFRELERIEALMSEWRPETPISQVNAAAGKQPVAVPEELRAIIRRAIAYGEKTEGAFDLTWRGMGNIWRFDDAFRVPDKERVEQARKNVDYRAVRLEGDTVFLERAGMAMGLGGLAKGYSVDRAARILKEKGFPDSLVAGAGDILASGTKGGEPWRLGVQDPRQERGTLLGTLPMSGRAISTSGDYERFRMVDGVRYHHIIDPRTGWPARECISVTVVAPTTEQTDALSTSIFILGPAKGLALAKAEGVDVLIIDAQGKRHATGALSHLQ